MGGFGGKKMKMMYLCYNLKNKCKMKRRRERRGGIDYSSLVKYLLAMLTKNNKKPNQIKQKKSWVKSPATPNKEPFNRPITS